MSKRRPSPRPPTLPRVWQVTGVDINGVLSHRINHFPLKQAPNEAVPVNELLSHRDLTSAAMSQVILLVIKNNVDSKVVGPRLHPIYRHNGLR